MRGSPIIHQAINLLPVPDRRCGGQSDYVVRRIDELGRVAAPYSNPRINASDTISSQPRYDHLMALQFFRLKSCVAFVVIALINASRINFTAIDIISQSGFEYMFNLNISDRAALHGEKIIFFIHHAPINNHMEFDFENDIQQIRVLRPLPSLKGWEIFISTYFSTISLNVDCGISSQRSSLSQ